MIDVITIPILSDNYAWLLRGENGRTAIVDPGEAGPVTEYLERNEPELDMIFSTHHHGDHTGGNLALKERYGAKVIGPALDAARIPGLDEGVSESSDLSFGGEAVHILETPGHTRGGLCFYFPESKMVFTGDTLFSMGCGRLFEGSAQQMWNSLQKIMALPGDTLIYCGHEYTESNGMFCLTVEPDNPALQKRMEEVRALRAKNRPTLPVSLETEKNTNVFLRAGSAERFAELRRMKDEG